MRWSSIAFLHWPVDVEVLRPLVLDELTIDTFEDQAWVGLVPFRMMVRPPFVPPIPLVSTFPEINVRTYVRDAHGRRGLYFLSLDVSALRRGARCTRRARPAVHVVADRG